MDTTTNGSLSNSNTVIELGLPTGQMSTATSHGFNCANLFTHLDMVEEDWSALKQSLPALLRFPGGTLANFYHFDRPGYGYQDSDRSFSGGKAIENFEHSLQTEIDLLSTKGIGDNHAVRMVALAEQTNSPVMLVANLLSSTDDEIMRMVAYFDNSEVDIAGIELGNEYYWSGAYGERFPNAEAYVERCKSITARMRSEFPDIPLGIVMAPFPSMKKMNQKKAAANISWNEQLMEYGDFDAMIVHLYAKNKECDTASSKEEKCSCYSAFTATYNQQLMDAALSDISEGFPDKDIWITEWNLRHVFDGLGDTMTQSIHYASFNLMVRRNDQITKSTYHNLLALGKGFNAFAKKQNRLIARHGGHVSRLFQQLPSEAELLEVKMPLHPEMLEVQAYRAEDDHLIIIKRDPTPLSLELSGALKSRALITSMTSENYSSSGEDVKWSSMETSISEIRLTGIGIHHILISD